MTDCMHRIACRTVGRYHIWKATATAGNKTTTPWPLATSRHVYNQSTYRVPRIALTCRTTTGIATELCNSIALQRIVCFIIRLSVGG